MPIKRISMLEPENFNGSGNMVSQAHPAYSTDFAQNTALGLPYSVY